jgi:hypothetical protein
MYRLAAMWKRTHFVAAVACSCSSTASASGSEGAPVDDHAAVFELEWRARLVAGGRVSSWRHVAFEVTPIERWLARGRHHAIHGDEGTEIPIDVLFKKP